MVSLTHNDRKARKMVRFSRVPATLEIERRFLLASPPKLNSPNMVHARPLKIVQTRLMPFPGFKHASRIRATRMPDGKLVYHWASKRKLSSMTKLEAEATISKRTYEELLNYAAPEGPQSKTRWRFTYEGLWFELDHVPASGDRPEHWLLEVELASEDQPVRLPPFLDIDKELTVA